MRRRRKSANNSSKTHPKHGVVFLILSIMLMLIGIAIIAYPITLTIRNYIDHEAVIHKLQQEDAEIPKIQAEKEIAAAQQYNASLAKSGQYLIGQGASDFMTSGITTNGVTKSPDLSWHGRGISFPWSRTALRNFLPGRRAFYPVGNLRPHRSGVRYAFYQAYADEDGKSFLHKCAGPHYGL